jgi:hypothetical protein
MSPCLLRIAHLPPDESDQFEGFEMPAMLPPPSLSFTIPSVHDDTILHCRVYHPACLAPTSVSQIAQWNKKAAIVAHPYAPLGGSYDDPVVDVIASTILKQGFIVGTFNFRFVLALPCRYWVTMLIRVLKRCWRFKRSHVMAIETRAKGLHIFHRVHDLLPAPYFLSELTCRLPKVYSN